MFDSDSRKRRIAKQSKVNLSDHRNKTPVNQGINTPSNNLVQRLQQNPQQLQSSDVITLQSSIGNRATASLLGRTAPSSTTSAPVVQPKLSVGPAFDSYELEADRIANNITRAPSSQKETSGSRVQRVTPVHSSNTPVGLQGGSVNGNFESKLRHAQTGGSALPKNVRTTLESKLGTDLSAVKIHTGSHAAQLSREIGAKAFTHKNHIFYGKGQSPSDIRLTAHEAVHTIQQGATGDAVARKSYSSDEVADPHAQATKEQADGSNSTPIVQANAPTSSGSGVIQRDLLAGEGDQVMEMIRVRRNEAYNELATNRQRDPASAELMALLEGLNGLVEPAMNHPKFTTTLGEVFSNLYTRVAELANLDQGSGYTNSMKYNSLRTTYKDNRDKTGRFSRWLTKRRAQKLLTKQTKTRGDGNKAYIDPLIEFRDALQQLEKMFKGNELVTEEMGGQSYSTEQLKWELKTDRRIDHIRRLLEKFLKKRNAQHVW